MGLSPQDRVELIDLVDRYAALVDERRFEDLAGLFTTDAELVTPGAPAGPEPARSHHGRAGVLTAMRPLGALQSTFHGVLGHVLDAGHDPDEASGRISCVAHHLSTRAEGGLTDLVWYLHYDDRYRHQDGRWLIRRRAITVQWTEVRRPRS